MQFSLEVLSGLHWGRPHSLVPHWFPWLLVVWLMLLLIMEHISLVSILSVECSPVQTLFDVVFSVYGLYWMQFYFEKVFVFNWFGTLIFSTLHHSSSSFIFLLVKVSSARPPIVSSRSLYNCRYWLILLLIWLMILIFIWWMISFWLLILNILLFFNLKIVIISLIVLVTTIVISISKVSLILMIVYSVHISVSDACCSNCWIWLLSSLVVLLILMSWLIVIKFVFGIPSIIRSFLLMTIKISIVSFNSILSFSIVVFFPILILISITFIMHVISIVFSRSFPQVIARFRHLMIKIKIPISLISINKSLFKGYSFFIISHL